MLGADGAPLPAGQAGRLVVRRAHEGAFLRYWKGAAPRGRWLPTGFAASIAADGTVALPADDLAALAAGNEFMGPEDVEHCLRRHPAVALAAVVGPADAMAGEHATAIIVPRTDASPGPALAEELRDFMRHCLPGHRTPRRVAFAKALPGAPEGRGALGSAVGLGARRG